MLIFLCGVVSTILSAWLFAGIDNSSLRRLKITSWSNGPASAGNGWQIRQWVGPGRRTRLIKPQIESNPYYDDPFDPPSWSAANRKAPENARQIVEHERGWPWLSLRCNWDEPINDYIDPGEQLHGGLAIRGFSLDWLLGKEPPGVFFYSIDMDWVFISDRESLPLVPIWPGFIASSFFYSLAWFVIAFALSTPAMLRRVHRRRRKRCIRCAYSLRGIDSIACPECGWERTSRFPFITGGRIAIAATVLILLTSSTIAFGFVHVNKVIHPSLMHLAARNNDVKTIQLLLANGSDVNKQLQEIDGPVDYDVYNSTPLMWAAAHGHTKAMRILIDAGADINFKAGFFGGNPLLIAARYGHADAIKMILESGAEVDAASGWHQTALQEAASNSHVSTLKALINAGADVNLSKSGSETAIFDAARTGTPETIRILLEAGSEINITAVNGWPGSPLSVAARSGRVDNMKVLLEAGADINLGSPLDSALDGGHSEAAMLLLDHGATVGSTKGMQLWSAAEKNLTDVARILLERGADPNIEHPVAKGWSPLRRAILRSNLELARMLVEAGADPHVVTDEGETILFWIEWEEALDELIEFVLSLGIDVNHKAHAGNTAIIHAVYWEHENAVKRLLQAGADPLLKNDAGNNALDYAQKSIQYDSGMFSASGHEPNPKILELILQAIDQ